MADIWMGLKVFASKHLFTVRALVGPAGFCLVSVHMTLKKSIFDTLCNNILVHMARVRSRTELEACKRDIAGHKALIDRIFTIAQ